MILFSSNVKSNILLYDYQTNKDNILLKNNVIYYNTKQDLELPDIMKVTNSHLNSYLY